MKTITVDFGKTIGAVKPLHGVNNGPITFGALLDVSRYWKDLGVSYARLHDPNWPHPREVDIPQIFPNEDADPDDPKSYDFRQTDTYIQSILDTGAKIIYRLGVSIEHTKTKYFTAPPKDFNRWARVCIGIIKHYNQGWADGFHYDMKHWEIWNEPDGGAQMWSGGFEKYLELYGTASRAIKDFDPSLKIGGYAVAYPTREMVPQFLAYCRKNKLPLDIFTWHTYADSLETYVENARIVRRLLDEHGFQKTETHLNEWNYAHNADFSLMRTEVGASFDASLLIRMQDEPVDVMNFYDGQPHNWFGGLFDMFGVPQKTFYAFKAFSALSAHPERAFTQPSDDGIDCLAAIDRQKNEMAILVSQFGGTADRVRVDIKGFPKKDGAVRDIYLMDAGHNLDLTDTRPILWGGVCFDIPVTENSVTLIRIR